MEKSLVVKKNEIRQYDLGAPSQMTAMSKVLQAHIKDQKLSTNIAGKEYTQVEGWQFAGGLLGYMPKVVSVENLSSGTEKKWRADVEVIRMKDGIVMGTGVAICSNTEAKKKTFDEYAIVSMAQTRAIGKAYRNLIGWVMKMAGYESTPTEEMTKVDQTPADFNPAKQSAPVNPVPAVNADQLLLKIKDKLMKLGAKNETEALELLKKKTGLVWKGFTNHTPVAIRNAYSSLLNAK